MVTQWWLHSAKYLKRTGSCGMMTSSSRRSWRPILFVWTFYWFSLVFIHFWKKTYEFRFSQKSLNFENQYSFINIYISFGWLDQSEHSHCQTRFSCACSSDDSDFFSTSNRTLNFFQNQWKSISITQAVFFKINFPLKIGSISGNFLVSFGSIFGHVWKRVPNFREKF